MTGTINTTGSSGDGGNVIAVAHNGSISMQNIDTSSTGGSAGYVLLMGGTGVSVNDVNSSNNNTIILVADALLTPDFTLQGGTISTGGLGIGDLRAGIINVHNVNSGLARTELRTSDAGAVNVTGNFSIQLD